MDEAVTGAVLRAIQPAALELSLATAHGLEQERKTLRKLWEQRLERAAYEAGHAQRQYDAVDPENRLVARELERQWEQKLCEQKRLQEDFRRFESTQPRGLNEAQRQEIRRLAEDLPALWGDSQNSERKTILREVVEAVIVAPRGESEQVELEIQWVGSSTTRVEIIRPVAEAGKLSYFPELSDRITRLVAMGVTAKEIAEDLNRRGLRPPNRATDFNAQSVSRLMRKLGLVSKRATAQMACVDQQLGEHEWSIPALAREIGMSEGTLRAWAYNGSVKARRTGSGPKPRWILWADDREIHKLRARKERGPAYYAHRRWVKEVEAREKASKQTEGVR